MSKISISISENGIWAGDGNLNEGRIEDCPAILGGDQDTADAVYEAIESAIAEGESTVEVGGKSYSWSIR